MIYCGVEQQSARQAHNLEIEGAIPSPASNFTNDQGTAVYD